MFWVVRMCRLSDSFCSGAKRVPEYASSVYGVFVLYIGAVFGEKAQASYGS